MSGEIFRTAVLLLALALPAFACGPRAAPASAGRTDCGEQCDLELMRCLENRVCVDLGGQRIPCLDECGAELASCEQACDGR